MTMQPAKEGRARSPYESLRLQGSIRVMIIGYGVAGLSLLLFRQGPAAAEGSLSRSVLYTLLTGLALQALLFIVRTVTARYERALGLDGYFSPLAIYLFELIVDAVTVFLFAWATYRGLLAFTYDL
jgi:hypothetical protein